MSLPRRKPLQAQTPIRRGKPLRSSSVLKTVTTLKRSKPKRAKRKEAGFPAAVKVLIRARAKGCCEACGIWVGEGGQCQHRRARGRGGSRNPVTNSAANGALLCGTPQSGCHGLCESRDEHMRAAGWWLQQWQDPRAEAVMLHDAFGDGVMAWLGDGEYLTEAPEVDAA